MDSYEKLNSTLANDTRIFLCYEVVTDAINGPKMLDRIILISLYGVTTCLIVVLNAYVYSRFKKEEKTRINVQFVVLTVSNLLNGMLSLPIVMLKFINFGDNFNCKIRVAVQFCYLFPMIYSWFITVGISIDRLVVLTISRLSGDLINRLNILYRVICFIFCLIISMGAAHQYWLVSSNAMTFKEADVGNPMQVGLSQIIIEACVVFLPCIIQMMLVGIVNRKESVMLEGGENVNSHNRKIINTISLLILFNVLTTVPRMITQAMQTYHPVIMDTRKRSGYYWINIGVLCLHFNSLFSALILLRRTSTFKVNTRG
ncbi:uncharacterized protein LOC130624121 [Hydractinia symbiolongicarpus]|uniref:uncharacterized protein LOC130624121 n=1 Tax=Hydractinia symbiolongicarpus TaxID=13093 RepID=UPI00254E45D4|nr:uncharacterized protein LOC130624121 [Hydractinia symbiolongicarpus]